MRPFDLHDRLSLIEQELRKKLASNPSLNDLLVLLGTVLFQIWKEEIRCGL